MASWQSFWKNRKEKHKLADWGGPVLYHCAACFTEIKVNVYRTSRSPGATIDTAVRVEDIRFYRYGTVAR